MEQKQYDDFFLALNSVAVVYKATLKPVDIPKNGVIQKAFAMHYQNNPVVPIFYPDRLINPEQSRTPGQIASALSRTVMPEIAELLRKAGLREWSCGSHDGKSTFLFPDDKGGSPVRGKEKHLQPGQAPQLPYPPKSHLPGNRAG